MSQDVPHYEEEQRNVNRAKSVASLVRKQCYDVRRTNSFEEVVQPNKLASHSRNSPNRNRSSPLRKNSCSSSPGWRHNFTKAVKSAHSDFIDATCQEIENALQTLNSEFLGVVDNVKHIQLRTKTNESDLRTVKDKVASGSERLNDMRESLRNVEDRQRQSLDSEQIIYQRLEKLEALYDAQILSNKTETANLKLYTDQKVDEIKDRYSQVKNRVLNMQENQKNMDLRLRTDIMELTGAVQNLNTLTGTLKGCNDSLLDNQRSLSKIIARNSESLNDLKNAINTKSNHKQVSPVSVKIVAQSPNNTDIEKQRLTERTSPKSYNNNDFVLERIMEKIESLSPKSSTTPRNSSPVSNRGAPLLTRRGGGYDNRWFVGMEEIVDSSTHHNRKLNSERASSSPSIMSSPTEAIKENIQRHIGHSKFPTVDSTGRIVYTSVNQIT